MIKIDDTINQSIRSMIQSNMKDVLDLTFSYVEKNNIPIEQIEDMFISKDVQIKEIQKKQCFYLVFKRNYNNAVFNYPMAYDNIESAILDYNSTDDKTNVKFIKIEL